MDAVELSPGLMVTHNVRLTRPLGEGAMGCVWVADHLTLQTQVAVKFISAELATEGGEVLARFVQEAAIAAQIKSPHVVQIFDQGVMGDGTPYMVMELLEGESLMEWLERRGRLSLPEAATVLVHVSRALRRAHERGVVHRDIKPDNIFVHATDDGLFCKVLDFGIAKQTKLPKMGLTNAGVMVGTPEYMSPEQVLSAKDVDFRADLWALAVTTYQMLTGHLPFYAEALGTLCVKLLDGKFQPASELRGDLPPGMDQWFSRALAHDPAERFESARAMAGAFVRLVARQRDLSEDESNITNVLSIIPNAKLGPQNRLGGVLDMTAPLLPSGLDGTAPLPSSAIDLTAPLPVDPTIPAPPSEGSLRDAGAPPTAGPAGQGPAGQGPAGQSPAAAGPRIAGTGTLTGSSANRRAEPSRAKWGAIVGAVSLGLALTAGVVVVSQRDEPRAISPEAAPAVQSETVNENESPSDDEADDGQRDDESDAADQRDPEDERTTDDDRDAPEDAVPAADGGGGAQAEPVASSQPKGPAVSSPRPKPSTGGKPPLPKPKGKPGNWGF